MTISSHPLIDLTEVDVDWPDEVVDLTDRRRILVRALLGVEVPPAVADAVFSPAQRGSGSSSSSTTIRSGGRSSSTDDT